MNSHQVIQASKRRLHETPQGTACQSRHEPKYAKQHKYVPMHQNGPLPAHACHSVRKHKTSFGYPYQYANVVYMYGHDGSIYSQQLKTSLCGYQVLFPPVGRTASLSLQPFKAIKPPRQGYSAVTFVADPRDYHYKPSRSSSLLGRVTLR